MRLRRSFIHRVFCSVALCAVFIVPLIALADDPPAGGASGSATQLVNPIGGKEGGTDPKDAAGITSIQGIIGNVIRAGFGVIGSIALLMFMYGGFTWLTSGGKSDKIEHGRDTMVWAALGLAVIFAGYAVTTFVIQALTKGAT